MYLLGYDLGSSSIKATLLDAESGEVAAAATCPKREMAINAPQSGWAQQDPEMWWGYIKDATAEILQTARIDTHDIKAIGISYQMHGLVIVDKAHQVLRPVIIWCDSRAVETGNLAMEQLGKQRCLERLLNSPGNFTASKLKWVKDNEPKTFAKVHKFMLPGDYLAMKLTGRITTTRSGLSEGILWDYQDQSLAKMLLDYYGIDEELVPELVDTFGIQGELTKDAAAQLGLRPGTKVTYRAGDQPNNALSLNVLEPGEIAATAGTSGVIYGIADKANYDELSRVNTFVHVNHSAQSARYGVLLCVSGTGILNSWLKHNVMACDDYEQMNALAAEVPIGADGLVVLPFGNGAERTLENRDIGSSIHCLNFNIHDRRHLLRSAQEGIVFALNYGLEIMQAMGVNIQTVRAGYANMFLSPVFSQAFATVTGAKVELYNTDGSQGAARGAGIGIGAYSNLKEAFASLETKKIINPDPNTAHAYQQSYEHWLKVFHASY